LAEEINLNIIIRKNYFQEASWKITISVFIKNKLDSKSRVVICFLRVINFEETDEKSVIIMKY
jgi:hypothetical protein